MLVLEITEVLSYSLSNKTTIRHQSQILFRRHQSTLIQKLA